MALIEQLRCIWPHQRLVHVDDRRGTNTAAYRWPYPARAVVVHVFTQTTGILVDARRMVQQVSWLHRSFAGPWNQKQEPQKIYNFAPK